MAVDQSCNVLTGKLEGGAIGDVANDATAYSQRHSLVRFRLLSSALCGYYHITSILIVNKNFSVQFNLAFYSTGHMPYPDDLFAFVNGIYDTISDEMPDGNFGVYPGYVECVKIFTP